MTRASQIQLTATPTGIRLAIFAKPRARASAIRGIREGALEVAIAAAPIDGAANEELIRFLAEVLGMTKRDIVLLAGESAKQKRVELRGVSEGDVRAALARAGLA
jgi:hypothetical protein